MADQNIKVNINLDLTEFNKNAKAMSDALSKVLGRDVKMFSDEMNKAETSINGVQKALGNAGKTASITGNSVKQSNQQWTSLALIIQDLPYGFRGIQNNLPALGASVAGFAGPAYLAFSTLIAAITAYDMGIFGATGKTNDFKKALKEVNDEIRNTVNYTNSEVSNLQGLVDVMLDVNTTESIRNKALQEAKEAITQVDEAQGKKIKTIGDAIVAINLYTEAIQQQQMQEVIGKRIAEISIGQIEKRNTLAIETKKANKGIHPINFFMGNTELQNLQTEIIANETLLRQLEDLRKGTTKALLLNPFSKYNAEKPNNKDESDQKARIKQEQNFNLQVLQDRITAKKQELKLYDDDAYKKFEVADQLAQAERDLSLKKIEYSEYDEKQKAILNQAVYKEYSDQILILSQAMQEQLLTQDAKTRKEKKKRDEQELREFTDAYKNQLKEFDDFYRNKQNLSTGDRLAQKSIYEQESSDLQYMLENNLITYDDYIKRLGETFKGWTNNNKAMASEAASYIQQIGNGLMSALGPSMDMLLDKGANIGEVLSKMVEDLIKQLAKVIVTAAIAAALISIIFPEKLATAGMSGMDVFSGLFTQGMGLGNLAFPAKKFANGGIVSGPTMGLVGEYPGAQNNPEVIAPLDKLKDMIGGGGNGTFVLRGQDLLLSVNRAQKASNLKGQNISLA